MSPALLLPAALAALAALSLPLAIHLARRSEQQPTPFAALRWLSEHPRPRSRLRFDEPWLLALRLLLLALVALFLARPVLTGLAGGKATLAVVPGADPARAGLDPAALRQALWLAPGFPRLDKGPVAPGAPVASLLRELDAGLPPGAPLTVVVPAVLQGADGERPRLSRPVRWVVTPGTMPEPAAASPPAAIVVRHDPAHAAEVRYLRAAVLALNPAQASPDVGGIDRPLPSPPARLVWLAGGTVPEAVERWVRAGGTALVSADAVWAGQDAAAVTLWADPSGAALAEARGLGAGRMLRFTRALQPAKLPALLDPDFPARLQAVLAPLPSAPARVAAGAYAPLAGRAAVYIPPVADLQPWLAVAIAALALVERWLATRRTRAISP